MHSLAEVTKHRKISLDHTSQSPEAQQAHNDLSEWSILPSSFLSPCYTPKHSFTPLTQNYTPSGAILASAYFTFVSSTFSHRPHIRYLCEEYKDIFSLHQGDIGHTKLLTINIDRGDHPLPCKNLICYT